jgi:AcrR family transcriptional regulator
VTDVFDERPVRREGDRELPVGPRARRTREAILENAAALFAEHGYQRTTVGDVAAAAGVSVGTVYQYFRDRPEILSVLVQRYVRTMLAKTDTTWRAEEGVAALRRVLGNFVESYVEVARLAGVWEEVTHVDERLADLRRALNRAFTGAVEEELRRASAAGVARSDVEVAAAARALTGMVDRYCYETYVFNPPPRPPAPMESADVLAKLWAAAVLVESRAR